MIGVTDTQKIGIGLASFGVAFVFLGILLLFDRGLLAIGNILFLSGLACVIGFKRTTTFFFQRHKVKATASFFGGCTIVLFGYPLIGMLIESYGFFLLFSGFFPVAINFLKKLPVLSYFFSIPGISKVADKLAGDSGRTSV